MNAAAARSWCVRHPAASVTPRQRGKPARRDQPCRGGLSDAGRVARAGPPAEVGVVLAGGSLAGKDALSASSRFFSASARDSRGGFRGSFIPAAPLEEAFFI
jgi:hypothetical protein